MTRDSAAFARLAEQLMRERSAAKMVVARVRRSPGMYLDEPLAEDWRTIGMAQELASAATDVLESSPQDSLALAQLALTVASSLPDDYPDLLRAQVEATAWKELSNAHRYRSEYPAALKALDRADRKIAGFAALTYDRAVIALARALTLREMNDTRAALKMLEEARPVFADHGDERRLAQCDLVSGMILYRMENRAAARDAYRRAAVSAQAVGDLHTLGAAYTNLGRIAAEQGDVAAALEALQQSRAIFGEMEMDAALARASWGVGVALLSAGKVDPAIGVLREVREKFLNMGLPEEAGLAGVDLVEALMATNARAAAHTLASSIVDEFRNANLNERALDAVAYLRDTAPTAPPRTAQYVGRYLREVRENPSLLFAPPPIDLQ